MFQVLNFEIQDFLNLELTHDLSFNRAIQGKIVTGGGLGV